MFVVGDHQAPVHALAFTPDNQGLFSAGRDGSVRLWDPAGILQLTLREHAGPVLALAVHPDGARLVTGGDDRSALLWDWTTATVLARYPAQSRFENRVCALAFLQDGQLLALGTGNRLESEEPGALRLGPLDPSFPRHRLDEPRGVWSIAAQPAGKSLAWAGGNKRVTCWDVTRPDRQVFMAHKNAIPALALAPDGQSFASADDWGIRLAHAGTGEERLRLVGHKGRVSALAYSRDGLTLLSGAWDRTVRVWEPSSGRERAAYSWNIGRVTALATSADGQLAAVAGDSGKIALWDLA